jgi:hypothetical protein
MAARIIEHGAPTGDGHSMLCPDKANDGSRRDAGATKMRRCRAKARRYINILGIANQRALS